MEVKRYFKNYVLMHLGVKENVVCFACFPMGIKTYATYQLNVFQSKYGLVPMNSP